LPKRPGEPDCTFADTTKNRQLLGWKPQISFEEGVKMMLDKIELWRDAPLWGQESISQATEPWFKYLGQSQQQWTNNGP
jgi:UDP-glucose 4-epimerase